MVCYDKLKVPVRMKYPLSQVLYDLLRPAQNSPGRCIDDMFLGSLGGRQSSLKGNAKQREKEDVKSIRR